MKRSQGLIQVPNSIVLHIVPDLRQRAGGIAATIPSLATAMCMKGVESRFLTYAHDPDFAWAEQTTCMSGANALRPGKLAREIEMAFAELPSGVPTVLHSHGLWSMLNCVGMRAAARMYVPTALSVHGMLLPWARRHKKLRKDIAWLLYQQRDLVQASAVHVTSQAEAATLAKIVPLDRVHVIPFGVDLPQSTAPLHKGLAPRTLLFLGRLHPVKNLETLIRAFVYAAPADYHLRLVGPDEDNYRSTLVALIEALRARDRVSISGPAYGAVKDLEILQAHGVILPSFTENFGAVVAEALAMGRPVIASTGTPWEALQTERCGWWVDPDLECLAQAIGAFCATSQKELGAMGERGRAYVLRSLNWNTAAAQMTDLYSSILSKQLSPRSRR